MLAGAAGLITAATLDHAVADADSARAEWGASVEVIVTRRPLRAGEQISPDDVDLMLAPARLVPVDAVVEPPTGLRVTTDVSAGEILVEPRLTSRAGSAASIGLPVGSRGVQLERRSVVGQVGDRVDLHALVSGSYLAQGVIAHADDESVTVAVPLADVAAVVDAISRGGLVSVLVP